MVDPDVISISLPFSGAKPDGTEVSDQFKVINKRIDDYPNRPIAGDHVSCRWLRYWESTHLPSNVPRTAGYPGRGQEVDLEAPSAIGEDFTAPPNYVYPDGSVVSTTKGRWVATHRTYWHVRE